MANLTGAYKLNSGCHSQQIRSVAGPAIALPLCRPLPQILERPLGAMYSMISRRILRAAEYVSMNMDAPRDVNPPGSFDSRYLALLETITSLRPRLYR